MGAWGGGGIIRVGKVLVSQAESQGSQGAESGGTSHLDSDEDDLK
jgi:hypothetical protein